MEIFAIHLTRGHSIFWLLLSCIILVSSDKKLWIIEQTFDNKSPALWIREPTFDNKSSATGYDINSRNRIHCGMTCSTNNTCLSFFFIPDQNLNCQLHASIASSLDGLLSTESAVYYVLEGASRSTTTPVPTFLLTTTPPLFSCPPDDTIFRTVLLDDGDHFTYKVVKNLASFSQALEGCAEIGSFLARVTTVAKMNMLLQLTRTCSGYSGTYGYYVDGSNAGATNYSAPGAWVMSTGELVPMSKDFWGATMPNFPYIQHCLRMTAGINYMWDDCMCSVRHYFICEK